MSDQKNILTAIDASYPAPARSLLSRWMRQNYDALASRLDGRRNDWTTLAEIFANANLCDRSGKPPRPDTARKAWERISKEIKTRRKPS